METRRKRRRKIRRHCRRRRRRRFRKQRLLVIHSRCSDRQRCRAPRNDGPRRALSAPASADRRSAAAAERQCTRATATIQQQHQIVDDLLVQAAASTPTRAQYRPISTRKSHVKYILLFIACQILHT